MSEIVPSILVKTQDELKEKIDAIEEAVGLVHLDIADGIFVPNTTIDSGDLANLDTDLRIEAHLMVSKPENHVAKWLELPIETIVFHIESTQKVQLVIDSIKEADKNVGIALNPATPTSSIEQYIDQADFIQFMTVEPGFYGGKFVDSVLEKVKDFHYYYPDKQIVVDGAVTPETISALKEVGASRYVVGSYLFNSSNLAKALERLNEIVG